MPLKLVRERDYLIVGIESSLKYIYVRNLHSVYTLKCASKEKNQLQNKPPLRVPLLVVKMTRSKDQ